MPYKGLRHGAFCLGCCWALMLVMFGLGTSGLDGCAHRGNSGGEDVPRRPAPELYHRDIAASAGSPVAGSSRVALG